MSSSDQPRRFGKNLALLLCLQSLSATASVILAAVNGLVGLRIAPSQALATLPVASFIVGAALSSYAGAVLMQRAVRRRGFQVGALVALLGAGLCSYAVETANFSLLCAGSVLLGVYNAFSQYHRFAAAEAAPPAFKSRAISWVLAGGVGGAVLGPESTKLTKDLTPTLFVGCYLSLLLIASLALLAASFVSIPTPPKEKSRREAIRVKTLLTRLDVATAMSSSVAGFSVMIFLMTATPLAMAGHHHPFEDTAFVIEWHVLGMFAPAFFTGSLIRRFGATTIILCGTALMATCVGINLNGSSLVHYWIALLLLGVGWNFMFIGGTTLLTQACKESEQTVAQGSNEVLTHTANAIASLSAGFLLHYAGWQLMNLLSVPFLLGVALMCLRVRRLGPSPSQSCTASSA